MNIKPENYIDRDVEIQKLSEIINSCDSDNNIILIYGISGIGKSGLVSKLKATKGLSSIIVTIKMTRSSIATIENLQYFNAIYKGLQEFSFKNNNLVLTPTQYGFSSFGNVIKYIFSLIKSKAGYGDAISISEPAEDESIIRKKDYITYILKKSNIILDIENIQNIDTQSFELLREIISTVKNRTFILEYTLIDNDSNHYNNMYKELLETNSSITAFHVEKMDFYYAQKLVPKNKNIDIALLEKKYDLSNGNLMEIILANEKANLYQSNINISLNDLSQNEKFVVYVVFLNDSRIEYDTLYTIIAGSDQTPISFHLKNDESFLENLVSTLCDKKILKYNDKKICLQHDSIYAELSKSKSDPLLFCAYSDVKNYYLNLLNCQPLNTNVIEKLVWLFLQFSDNELLNILPNVKNLILNIKYPNLVINKLKEFRKNLEATSSINKQCVSKLALLLVEVCAAKKLCAQAQENLDLIFDANNIYHIALQGEIYALQEDPKIENKLSKLVSNAPINSRLRLILELCEMYYGMKIYNSEKSRDLAKKILQNEKYKEYKEYAFVLRNYAELCDSHIECKKYYYSALKIFKEHNMYFDMACIYVSLSMIFAYEGKLQIARNCINKAIKLDTKNLSQCYILNNKSVIDLLEGTYSLTTEKSLKDAALLSVSEYERIIIECNLLIFYCKTMEFDKAKLYAQRIENSGYQKFSYEEFLHIVYQNLLFYYNTVNDTVNSNYYYKRIMSLVNDADVQDSTKELAKSMNGLSPQKSFYSQFKFRADFLGYWEFTIDNDLNHC